MRRWFGVSAFGAALAAAACGLSARGTLDEGGDASARVLDAAILQDVEVVSADGAADAGGMRPDARPADAGDCKRTTCGAQVGTCTATSCGTSGTSPTTFTSQSSGTGGSTSTANGDCYASCSAGGRAVFTDSLPAASSFFYELRFLMLPVSATKGVIAESGAVRLELDGTTLRMCAEGRCTPSVALPGGNGAFQARVYGTTGTAQRYGSAILQIGCVESGSLELDGPLAAPDGKVHAAIGCASTTASCNVLFDDVLFAVVPM